MTKHLRDKRRVLFIDRDGTLIKENPPTYQIDSWEKLEFYPYVFTYMNKIATELDFVLVMVSNQDGLGTDKFPEDSFTGIHNHIIRSFENEGVFFREVHIDCSLPEDNLDTRKPGTGMLKYYLDNPDYDIANSFVIGDRITDILLAKNLGCQAIWLKNDPALGNSEFKGELGANGHIALETKEWREVWEYLYGITQVT